MKGRLAMTKKHFIELADVIRKQKPIFVDGDSHKRGGEYLAGRLEMWEWMRDRIADFCATQNSRFDRARWLGYVAGDNGPNGGKAADGDEETAA